MKITTEIDAKKERFGEDEVIDVLKGVNKLLVAKGKKITTVDLKKDRPDDLTLAGLITRTNGKSTSTDA